MDSNTIDMVNLPCPEFEDLVFIRISPIFIFTDHEDTISKLKTAVTS